MSEIPAAPFQASAMSIDPAWIDYNGHLNQAYYAVLFDRSLDEILVHAGFGPGYITERRLSYMTVESHFCYVRELFKDHPVRVSGLVVDMDDKRLHMFCELRHAGDGWLACTSEWMFLHVDMVARRAVPWPPDVAAKLAQMRAASAKVGRPDRAGRAIAVARKKV